ncbi:DUF7017 domain-containing protein [Lacihabitans lacunae]|uniref:DUF7017 domain-containing protein n=1 Tax=Lacihabitans lacunae TaxID=1028214 RepID=A0ABV7YTW8_9BACT
MIAKDWEKALEIKNEMFKLPFQTDNLLKKQTYWLVIKTISLSQELSKDSYHTQEILSEIMKYARITDTQLTSAFIWASSKVAPTWKLYLDFMLWVNFDKLKEPQQIEKNAILIAKNLLSIINKEESTTSYFTNWIYTSSEQNPEMPYLKYYAIKLLIKDKNIEKAHKLILELLQVKQKEFWVWHLLSSCYQEKPDLQFSVFCKAISLNNKPEMLRGVRQDFMRLLIKNEMWANAKYEIEEIIDIRKSHGWQIPEDVRENLYNQNIINIKSEKVDYRKFAKDVEQEFLQTLPKAAIAITKIDLQNGYAYYITENQVGGKFPLSITKGTALKVGDSCYGYMTKHVQKNFDIIKSVVLSKDSHSWLKSFEGVLSIKSSGIGFVDCIYLSERIILKNKLTNNVKIKGLAIRSYDAKKSKEGWSGIIVFE